MRYYKYHRRHSGRLDPWTITRGKTHAAMTVSEKLHHILQSLPAHYIIVVLLVLDILLVAISITLEIEYLHSQVSDCEDVVDTCQEEIAHASNSSDYTHSVYGGSMGVLSGDNDPHGSSHCHVDHIGLHSLHDAEKKLAYASMSILCVFIVENMLLFASKPYEFIQSPMHVLDFFVVVVSLLLEIAFQNDPEGGLLIIARTWRFARIGHGLYESREDESLDEMVGEIRKANHDRTVYEAYKHVLAAEEYGGDPKEAVKELDPTITFELLKAVGPYLSKHKGPKPKQHDGEDKDAIGDERKLSRLARSYSTPL
mmetsp:Transcript_14490/g.21817  ORF Transcript_14490/g.21817 Transcript_14490/m.21817 type:complete len:312 (+) Transcript_14490:59-994(+)